MASRYLFRELYMQATTLCNLDCGYCYLPERKQKKQMSPEVAAAVAASLSTLPNTSRPIDVKWHCGEPLACPRDDFAELLAPFRPLVDAGRVQHRMQTNATLIDDEWCALFLDHRIQIGVSIDGPAWANTERVDWAHRPVWEKTVRGIEALKRAGIPLYILAVVTDNRLDDAQRLYDFFCDLGCDWLGLLIEERIDDSGRRSLVRSHTVSHFWRDLARAWQARPQMYVREIEQVRRFLTTPAIDTAVPLRVALQPTVAWDGDVVMLSPELLQQPHAGPYGTFSVGNVLADPFVTIVGRAKQAPYVLDFLRGVDACRAECAHYTFCKGGNAANRFFEHGHLAGTQTDYCLHTQKHLLDACAEMLQPPSA